MRYAARGYIYTTQRAAEAAATVDAAAGEETTAPSPSPPTPTTTGIDASDLDHGATYINSVFSLFPHKIILFFRGGGVGVVQGWGTRGEREAIGKL